MIRAILKHLFRRHPRPFTGQIHRILRDGSMSGRDVNTALGKFGYKLNGVEFYHEMARLEDKGIVRGWYEERVIDGFTVMERWFALER